MIRYTLLYVCLLIITACHDDGASSGSLPAQQPGTGDIITNVQVVHPPVIDRGVSLPEEFIIRSSVEDTFGFKVRFDSDTTLQAIDYSQYSLLGNYASGTCRAVFMRDVSRDNVSKEVVYRVDVKEQGDCERLWSDPNVVLVPRIPDNYTISFSVTKEKVD